MPIKYPLSHIKMLPFDFGAEVDAFIKAKMDHRFTEGVAAPGAAHVWVEHAVKRVPGLPGQPDTFVADYEIHDDTPPPPTLDQRKAALANASYHEAMAIIEKFDPPLKRRLADMDAHDATHTKPEARTAAHIAALDTQKLRVSRTHMIHRHLATIEAQIHDLTADTIDAWKPAPFPDVT